MFFIVSASVCLFCAERSVLGCNLDAIRFEQVIIRFKGLDKKS